MGQKRKDSNESGVTGIAVKKVKKTASVVEGTENKIKNNEKSKFSKVGKNFTVKPPKDGSKKHVATKKPTGKGDSKVPLQEKPEDWNKFKKEKKDLKLKRKQKKTSFDVVVKAKKIGELLRRKILKEGEVERNKLINELHDMLKGNGHYSQFVLAHDTARIVQWMLKYSSPFIRLQISKELSGVALNMMQSKYGIFCVKRLLKYGNAETRSDVVKSFYGKAVKLSSHVISAPVLEYAYTTWATQLQKYHLIQEFYGDIYKNSKDDNVKSLKDVFISSPDLKAAALGATKANINKILNKKLLDSSLVQTVIHQFLIECSTEDKNELISQLVPHIVVIGNSKDGARAAMECIWHGSNKDRKIIMKLLKEHLIELCKHEHGHYTIITLLDASDDTVLLNKIILTELLKNARDLSLNEWGRKVLLWTVVPGNSSYFHPLFINELVTGREKSTSKKDIETRRKEILTFASPTLLNLISSEPEFWLSNGKVAYEMLAIVKSAITKDVQEALDGIVRVITKLDWKIKEKENEEAVIGIEHPGMHLTLKKIAQHDKTNIEKDLPTFGASLIKPLTNEVIQSWIQSNRGCFLLVTVLENCSEAVRNELLSKLSSNAKILKKLKTPGAKILSKKLSV